MVAMDNLSMIKKKVDVGSNLMAFLKPENFQDTLTVV